MTTTKLLNKERKFIKFDFENLNDIKVTFKEGTHKTVKCSIDNNFILSVGEIRKIKKYVEFIFISKSLPVTKVIRTNNDIDVILNSKNKERLEFLINNTNELTHEIINRAVKMYYKEILGQINQGIEHENENGTYQQQLIKEI